MMLKSAILMVRWFVDQIKFCNEIDEDGDLQQDNNLR